MNKNPTRLCYAFSAVLLLLYLSACRNPVISDKSNNLDFKSLGLSYIDTCTVVIHTVPDRPLVSSSVSVGVLGSMDDAFFGKTYAGIYAQCLLEHNDPGQTSFEGALMDSAVLTMPFLAGSPQYGKCNQAVDILVYELSQSMVPGNIYYCSDAFSVYSRPIGSRSSYIAAPGDSVYLPYPFITPVPTQNQAPQLRIRLSNTFANKLINVPDTTSLGSLSFVQYFKGLYITTDPSKPGNGLMYFDLNNSAINLYYHHPSYTPIDTQVFQFQISTYGATANHFDHYYGGTPVQTAMNNTGLKGDKAGYIQAGGGTRVKLTIPYLANLDSTAVNGKKVINNIGVTKAELIVPIVDTLLDDPGYHPPTSLTLSVISDNDSLVSLSLNDNSGIAYLTNRFDNNNKSYLCYVFTLTQYMQQLLNGNFDNKNGYYIGYSSAVRGDRAIILNDPAKVSAQCKLNITYTKLQ